MANRPDIVSKNPYSPLETKTMIKIMTMNTGDQPRPATGRLQDCLASLHHDHLDILCCQSLRRAMDGSEDPTPLLARSLGMTSSCFAVNRRFSKEQKQGKGESSGLAILTGVEVWMLNSGCLSIPDGEEGEEWIGQFALVRKNSTSILVLNLQLASSAQAQSLQLRAVFAHPLLKEHYGAVVLCGDRHPEVSAKELRAITTRSNYALDPGVTPAAPGKGMLCLFTARDQPEVTVTTGRAGASQPGPWIEFEVNRIPEAKKARRYMPLSFREQWLGYKEKYPAFAA
jgi:hypothetical protein